jgi:all-trans-retinol 13,14-reductase
MSAKQYDVVILGGGLGGLLCATMLAKEGMKVCVLEKNRQIGGCLQTFALHKKVFDACIHYIGGLGEGHTLHQIFQYAGIMDTLPLHGLDRTGFDQIIFGDEQISYPLATREHFVERLLPQFPKEEAALKQYLALISEVASQFALYDLRIAAPTDKMSLFGLELMSTLRGLTKDERLVQVLAGNNMLYGGVDGQTPFYTHAMSTEGYLHSVHKAVPGSSAIAKLLWKELQKQDGEVHRYADVKLLHEEGGEIQYAQTADGRRWEGKNFISAIHPAVLFAVLDGKGLRPAFKERVKNLPHTPPGVMINMVLKPGVVPYPGCNIYWHPSGEGLAKMTSEGVVWPDTQSLFYNKDDANPGFAESVTVLVYADDHPFAKWEDSENITGVHVTRNKEYQAKKEEYAAAILEKTFRRFPELKDNIVAKSISTPLTLRDYTGTPDGSLYGPLKDAARPGQTSLAVRTRIPNLLLTGQNLNMHGVMGVSISAVATCGELLGMDYLLGRIKQA